MPSTEYLCVCRRCLQNSAEGQYHSQRRTVQQHEKKYGTNALSAEIPRRHPNSTTPRRTVFNEADIEKALALVVGGSPLPTRTRTQTAPISPAQIDFDTLFERPEQEEDIEMIDDFLDMPPLRDPSSDEESDSEADEAPTFNVPFIPSSEPPAHGANGSNLLDRGSLAHLQDEDMSDDDTLRRYTTQELEKESSESDPEDRGSGNEQNTSQDTAPGNPPTYHIEEIQIARKFIHALETASLDDIDPDVRHNMHNPPDQPPSLSSSQLFSIEVFLATSNASEDTYNNVQRAYEQRHPENEMLTLYKVKKLVQELSGVIPVTTDMCYNSCTGFTGPFSALLICPYCGEDRYTTPDGSTPRKTFHTMPIGPQLQALWRSSDGATAMQYRKDYTEHITKELGANAGVRSSPYRDIFDGFGYLDAVKRGDITENDMAIMLSIDGAQLYRMKASDCWIYIWVILDLNPNIRYQKKHVIPGGVIPGPNKPKNLDSYLLPGLVYLAVAQKHGLRVWDARSLALKMSKPFFVFGTADGPAMAAISGCVGHHGKYGCQLYCPLTGRHKPGGAHYYPALLKPDGFAVAGCDHTDVDLIRLLKEFNFTSARKRYEQNLTLVESSCSKNQYERNRLETGICRPSLFSGLPQSKTFSVPAMFPGDNMHLPCLNITDIYFALWRGTLDCDKSDSKANWDWVVLVGDTWKTHGATVAAATPYIPGSFDRPPRNPAEKISSGYKAWEFLLYFYGLGPALFHGIVPTRYYRHYCKLVRGMRLMLQEDIAPKELLEADKLLSEFAIEYEDLYVQRRADRIHFVRQSIHAPVHMAHEVVRCGPGKIYSQWVIERTIGNLGEEIRQHSNAFSNLAQRAVLRCQVNAMKVIMPELDRDTQTHLPRNALDLGHGYVLLPARDSASRLISEMETEQIHQYLSSLGTHLQSKKTKIIRWARLRLPNGQIARSRWKEAHKPVDKLRCARHVRIIADETDNVAFHVAEVLYYMVFKIQNIKKACAMVSYFNHPDQHLLEESFQTYWTATKRVDGGLKVIDTENIQSVVMMAPDPRHSTPGHWYLMEKPGQGSLQSIDEELDDEEVSV